MSNGRDTPTLKTHGSREKTSSIARTCCKRFAGRSVPQCVGRGCRQLGASGHTQLARVPMAIVVFASCAYTSSNHLSSVRCINDCSGRSRSPSHTHTCTCTQCMHAHTCTHTHMHTHGQANAHTQTYTRMHMHTYTCTHSHARSIFLPKSTCIFLRTVTLVHTFALPIQLLL